MRPVLADRLLTNSFWLMDIAPLEALAVPVLTPLFGFSSITAPEITADVEEIREGNWYYPKKVVKSGNVGNITLQRGATFYDADFYRWMIAALQGDTQALQSRTYGLATTFATADLNALDGDTNARAGLTASLIAATIAGALGFPRIGGPTYRRDMLLIQYFARSPLEPALTASLFASAGAISTLGSLVLAQVSLAAVTTGRSVTSDGNALVEASQRLPARSWMLRGCVPVRYKAGGDFDASASEVSIQELEMAVEDIEELSLAA